MGEVAGGIEVLGKKERKLLDENTNADEEVLFCLVGMSGQAIVATSMRVLVIKAGWAAGAAFGGKVTAFYYRDITGIEVRTTIMAAVIEVTTPSFGGGVQPNYWIHNDANDPRKMPHCIPTYKSSLKEYQPYLEQLRERIHASKAPVAVAQDTSSGLGSELAQLASLRAAGVLSEEEFAQAKQRLLAG